MSEYATESPFYVEPALASRLASAKEAVWLRIGALHSVMNDRERALDAFERVLAVNPANVRAMTQAGAVLAKKECYPQAVAYLQRAISSDATCGEAWAVLAHCYVMTDDLQKAYQAYQSALSHLPNPRDPNLWYGIGLLYDRYGSLDNAVEAFLAVLNISPEFERADEVCFCIGIIYKEQQNFDQALKYFQRVVTAANPPPPLTRADGWYQIGHVNELKRDFSTAFDMYKAALVENPKHPKTLQNIGWLEHQHNNNSQEAIRLLKLSSELDASDGQTWYLLGRVYMALREFRLAYDAYQQAVYRDGRNATFWCSIGVLYYQMNQFRDAMDAYSRAIRLNPYVSEVWYDLGTLYESCGQNPDAIDAYRRAAELAPDNTQITARLGVLENSMTPSALQQQQAAQVAAATSQAQGLQPGQIQPDLHHAGQAPHLQSHAMLNRPMAPLGPISQSLQQQKLPQQAALPPSHHMAAHSRTLDQTSGGPSAAQRSGHMDIAPISALRPHGMAQQSQTMGMQSGGFSQDTQPSLPAPLTAMNASVVSRPSPMMSQPLHTQQSNVLPPPNAMTAQQEPMHGFRRSGPMSHTQLTPLNHHAAPPDSHRVVQMSHADQQQPNQLPSLTSSQPQVVQQPQQPGQEQGTLPSLPHPQASQPQAQSSPHMSPHELRAQAQQARSQQVPLHSQTQLRHSQPLDGHSLPPQAQTGPLPHIQALPQLSALPQIQQHPEQQKEPEVQHHPVSGPVEPSRHVPENDRAQYMPTKSDPLRRLEFERTDDGRLPKIPKHEGPQGSVPFPSSASDGTSRVQPVFVSNAGPIPSISSSGPQIPALREPGVGATASASGPPPPHSMSMHEITQPESHGPPRRMEEVQREERGQNDRARSDASPDSKQQNGEKSQIPDRLPGMSSLSSAPISMKDATRESREDARLLTSVATPSLPIPSSTAVPSVVGSDGPKVIPSPVPAPSASGTSSAMGSGAPPLPPMSSRPQSSLTGLAQEPKESQSAIGTSGLAPGASSFTKFGQGFVRTPATPVNSSSVAPSSLPSPLPARKGPASAGVVHAARSPRISKPTGGSAFKSVQAPPSNSGQIESVPSPSSLPVLPALSSHPSNGEKDKASPEEDKAGEQETFRDKREALSDGTQLDAKLDERSGKETAGARKNEDNIVNKPILGILRSAPAPVPAADAEKMEDEKVKSPRSSAGKLDSETTGGVKREGSSNDEPGRTAKRPRLISDSETTKPFRYDDDEKQKKGNGKNDLERNKEDDQSKRGPLGSVKSDVPSFKETKTDLRTSDGSPTADPDKPPKREGISRSGETDNGKNLGMGTQVMDLPRLSAPVSKLSGPPPLPANTPLPSFRAERMNLTASRGGSGSGSGGKTSSQENTSRFSIRSAPITSSLPAPLKSHVSPSSRSAVDKGDGTNPQKVDSPGAKRISEDKAGSSPMGGDDVKGRVANGDPPKGTSVSTEHDSRNASEVKSKDEKQSRTEIHSSAT